MSKQRLVGEVDNRLIGRKHQLVMLINDITFVDKNGVIWFVPAGFVYDGSSIPPLVWWIYGSPFVGPHRRGAPFHDYECYKKNKPCKMVHEMYREFIIWDGTPEWKANQMHYGISLRGPKW